MNLSGSLACYVAPGSVLCHAGEADKNAVYLVVEECHTGTMQCVLRSTITDPKAAKALKIEAQLAPTLNSLIVLLRVTARCLANA